MAKTNKIFGSFPSMGKGTSYVFLKDGLEVQLYYSIPSVLGRLIDPQQEGKERVFTPIDLYAESRYIGYLEKRGNNYFIYITAKFSYTELEKLEGPAGAYREVVNVAQQAKCHHVHNNYEYIVQELMSKMIK